MLKKTRRAVLLGTAGLTALAVAGCAGQTSAQVTAEAVAYATSVANGLATFLSEAQGIPPALATTINGYVQDALQAAQALSTSMTQTQGLPYANQIAADVAAVVADVQGLPIGAQAQTVLTDLNLAVSILLPLFTAGQNILGAPAPSPEGKAAMTRLQALPPAVVKK